jgi:hypothetical protein
MSRAARTYALASVLSCVCAAGSLEAAPETPSKAAAATTKARAALPVPAEGNGLTYTGELWVDGVWAGAVKLTAEAGTFAEKPAWFVSEDVFWHLGDTEWRLGASYTLARDLSLLRGEIDLRHTGVLTKWTLARGVKCLEGTKQVIQGEVEGGFDPVTCEAPAGATAGFTALALLLRGPLPAGEKALEVAWLDPAQWLGGGAKASVTLALEIAGEATFDGAPGKPQSLETRATGAKAPGSLHIRRKERTLLGWTGLLDAKVVVLPQGTRPEGAKFDEKLPARSWEDALLKFGVGYHMAREDVLAAAFHWDSWYEYEVGIEGWAKERPVKDFRREWLDAFLAASKHRSRSETDVLLGQMLATGRLETKSADRVVFHADAQFGGGTQRDYHLKRIDNVWYIVRIDSNE